MCPLLQLVQNFGLGFHQYMDDTLFICLFYSHADIAPANVAKDLKAIEQAETEYSKVRGSMAGEGGLSCGHILPTQDLGHNPEYLLKHGGPSNKYC